jgi:hypothetical protein
MLFTGEFRSTVSSIDENFTGTEGQYVVFKKVNPDNMSQEFEEFKNEKK